MCILYYYIIIYATRVRSVRDDDNITRGQRLNGSERLYHLMYVKGSRSWRHRNQGKERTILDK